MATGILDCAPSASRLEYVTPAIQDTDRRLVAARSRESRSGPSSHTQEQQSMYIVEKGVKIPWRATFGKP
jgi:hypothetical protein